MNPEPPADKGNIFLIGLMGVGKTTIGRLLADRLGKAFIDMDAEIEDRCGVKVAHIFDIEGEAGFRKRETKLLAELSTKSGVVVATGGGAVLAPENRKMLAANGTVVYLCMPIPQLAHRMRNDRKRPLLQNQNIQEVLQKLHDARDPLYREIADITIDSTRQPARRIASRLAANLDKRHDRHRTDRPVNSPNPSLPRPIAMTTLTIDLDSRSYPIEIDRRLLDDADLFSRHLKPGQPVVIVTNETVAPLYLDRLTQTLSTVGASAIPIILPDGEEYKTAKSLSLIHDEMLKRTCDRKTPVIALGGGVIGDLAGFAAATYQRGVPFIQVPTTLLAQVDSAVGGKTGINHPLGKNMIGAFYQPKLVVADIDTLSTLEPRDYRSGIAEIIKYGLIADELFFVWLEENIEALLDGDIDRLSHAIYQSCLNKKRIVDADEFEAGQRALLNLGHTFGHAIETATGYGQWRHGEAVAVGMIMAADLSARLGRLEQNALDRTIALIAKAQLPLTGPATLSPDDYLTLMAHDKKNLDGKLRLILLDAIGKGVIVSDVPTELIVETIQARS